MPRPSHCFDLAVLRSKPNLEKENPKLKQFKGRPSHQRRYTYHADSEQKSYTATSHVPRGGRISRRPSWHACTGALIAAGAPGQQNGKEAFWASAGGAKKQPHRGPFSHVQRKKKTTQTIRWERERVTL